MAYQPLGPFEIGWRGNLPILRAPKHHMDGHAHLFDEHSVVSCEEVFGERLCMSGAEEADAEDLGGLRQPHAFAGLCRLDRSISIHQFHRIARRYTDNGGAVAFRLHKDLFDNLRSDERSRCVVDGDEVRVADLVETGADGVLPLSATTSHDHWTSPRTVSVEEVLALGLATTRRHDHN